MGTLNLSGNGVVRNLAVDGLKNSHQTCKAWIYFDGSGTVGINSSYNVSSLTDLGTGDYKVSFTNNMSSVNYAVAGSSHIWSSYLSTIRAETTSVDSVNIEVIENNRADSDHVHAIIFGAGI